MPTWMPPSVDSVNHTKPGTHLDLFSYRRLVVFMWLSLQLILPFHNQPVSHSPHSHTSCPLIQGSLELAPTNAHRSNILAMKWRHHLCRGVIGARTHTHKKGGREEKNSEASTTNLYCVKSEVTRGEATNSTETVTVREAVGCRLSSKDC